MISIYVVVVQVVDEQTEVLGGWGDMMWGEMMWMGKGWRVRDLKFEAGPLSPFSNWITGSRYYYYSSINE